MRVRPPPPAPKEEQSQKAAPVCFQWFPGFWSVSGFGLKSLKKFESLNGSLNAGKKKKAPMMGALSQRREMGKPARTFIGC